MAINLESKYPGQVEAADANYPLGGAKNETAPSSFDGTPFEKAMLNDIFGFEQALLKIADITESGNSDTAANKTSSQYAQAILMMLLSNHIFNDIGVADAYDLETVGNNPAPASYEDNMSFQFIVGATNTGASTAEVEGLPVKAIKLNGVDVTAGELLIDERVTIVFDAGNDWFELVLSNPTIPYILIREEQAAGTDAGTSVTGSWLTRVLNTEVIDSKGKASLAANQITLEAGTYKCRASSPFYVSGDVQIRLRNVTGAVTLLEGTSEVTNTSTSRSEIVGQFTIAAAQALEVQYQVDTPQATTGLGKAANYGEKEVYTIIEFEKVA